ncbi:MAG: hypothetical protein JSW36_17340 [Burkholderiales bacterium]|nr:MAG: hypothetical protein JSW36_17340 [Burkholderiales bacterium]
MRGLAHIHALGPVLTCEPVEGLIVQFWAVTVANAGETVRRAALHRVQAAVGVPADEVIE